MFALEPRARRGRHSRLEHLWWLVVLDELLALLESRLEGRLLGLRQLLAFALQAEDRKSTRLNSSHLVISYAVFCLKKKNARQDSRSTRAVQSAPCRLS